MNVKKWNRKVMLAATAGASVLGFHANGIADVVIHNNGFDADNDPLPGGQSYGSNAAADADNWTVSVGEWGITGAPDIVLFWDGESGGNSGYGLDTYTNWNGRGNVVQLDHGSDGPNPPATPFSFITFTPTATAGVNIKAFDLDAWAGGGDISVDWAILDNSSNVLADGTWSRDNSGGRDTISPDFRGNLGQELVLRFHQTSGDGTYLALDNLTFAQIPEPSSAVVLASGFAVLAMRRRRKN